MGKIVIAEQDKAGNVEVGIKTNDLSRVWLYLSTDAGSPDGQEYMVRALTPKQAETLAETLHRQAWTARALDAGCGCSTQYAPACDKANQRVGYCPCPCHTRAVE